MVSEPRLLAVLSISQLETTLIAPASDIVGVFP